MVPYNSNMTYLLMKCTVDPHSLPKILHFVLGYTCVMDVHGLKRANFKSKLKFLPPVV